MADKKSLSKYRVYFFLYLAVVCELLIIIVERDDAEAAWLKERQELQTLILNVVRELLSTPSTAHASGSSKMTVGETRTFLFTVKGLGNADSVIKEPKIYVHRNGILIDSFTVADNRIINSIRTNEGEIRYTFAWTAAKSGSYQFVGETGTDRVGMLNPNTIKIGPLEIPRRKIEKYIDSLELEEYITQSAHISTNLLVDVIAAGDPLAITAYPAVTARGFLTTLPIEVEGTSPERVYKPDASLGSLRQSADGKWLWEHTFQSEGNHTIRLRARDNRGEPTISTAETSFLVTVKVPYLVRKIPSVAFADEIIEMSIRVHGLEDIGLYTWKILLDGIVVKEGSGDFVRWVVPSDALGKKLEVQARYTGKLFPVVKDSTTSEVVNSDFTFTVEKPRYNLHVEIQENGEYIMGSDLQFIVRQCGNCSMENRRGVSPRDVRLTVEDELGRDMLDNGYEVEPMMQNGKEVATRVRFRLKKRNIRNNVAAVVVIRTPTETKEIPITIVKE